MTTRKPSPLGRKVPQGEEMTRQVVWRVVMILSITASLAGCVASPTPTATPTAAINMREAARGYWETVTGKLTLTEYPGKIYYYDWYAIEIMAEGNAIIIWDNGLNCTRTEAHVEANQIRLVADDVETTFVIHDATHATVTFRRGWQVYVKKLQKVRNDPMVICM
jgi:hypothetical protein